MHIKSIKSPELWSDKQLQTISYGGNSTFDEYLEPYLKHLEVNKYQINVFKIAAAEFYRKRLDAFTNLGYFSEAPPSAEDGSVTIEYETELISGERVVDMQSSEGKENLEEHKNERLIKISDEDRDGLDKIGDEIKDLWEATGDIFSEHSKAAWDSTAEFRAKASNATQTALDGASTITKETWSKTKDIGSSAWSKTGDFFSYIGSKASETIGDVKQSDTYKSGAEKVSSVSKIGGIFSWFGSSDDNQNKEEEKESDQPEKQYFDFEKPKE